MTLDEAIKHTEKKARELESTCVLWKRLADEKGTSVPSDYEPCKKWAEAHRQLAEWLKELKRLRNRTVEEKEPPTVKIGDEVIVDGCKGIIIREPYQIGRSDDPLSLVLVWYGRHMGDAKLRDVQPTGKRYPEIVKIMEELKEYEGCDAEPVEDKQTCDNCGQDHKYCEPTNKEQFGFCGNWAEHQ